MISKGRDRRVLADCKLLFSANGVARYRAAFERELHHCKNGGEAAKLFILAAGALERFTKDCERKRQELEDATVALKNFTDELNVAVNIPTRNSDGQAPEGGRVKVTVKPYETALCPFRKNPRN